MFLFFEMEIPNGLPKHFIYIPIDDTEKNNMDNNIQNGKTETSEMSGIAASEKDLVDYEQDSSPGSEMGPPPEEEMNMPQQEPIDQQYAQEMEPLKKLYLLQKLRKLNDTLEDNNYGDPKLELILKYGSKLSYDTLLKVSDKLTNELNNSLKSEPHAQHKGETDA